MPIRLYWRDGDPHVDWCFMGDTRFTEPFFEDTIQRRMRKPFNMLFRHRTSMNALEDVAKSTDVIPPTGFVFHMSRCGSTLVAQMFAALETSIVISEAPPIDSVLGAGKFGVTSDDTDRWLRSLIDVFGRRRSGIEKRFFIKFDSWNTLDLDRISRVFPDVPWIFLYRNPVEVIVSHMRQRGSQMIPGAIERMLPDLSFDEVVKMPAEEYCGLVLERFLEAALAHADDRHALLVNYDELPAAATGSIASHFRADLSTDEISSMLEASRFNAKSPQMSFEADAARKRNEASDAAWAAAARWADPLYEQLESKRLSVARS